ncbi:MAG: FAD-dependent monooxygenase [Anaerolineae bacterium]
MTKPDYELMIVGGGPAGISTWLHLQKLDPALAARTVIIEKATYPRHKLCGGGVTRPADMVLAKLRLRINVPSVPIHKVELRFGHRKYTWHRPNIFRVVRRHEFDHALARAAVDRGAKLRENEAFRDFARVDGGLLVETSRGQYTVRALIGADGARGGVRPKMGLAERPRVSRLIEILTPADAGLANNTAVFDFSAVVDGLQGYVWDFPCLEDGLASMNRGVFDSRVRPDRSRADLKRIFKGALQARDAYDPSQPWEGHPERWFSARGVFAQPHVLLAGDAAGVEPAMGEGISQALQYGQVAAATLAAAFQTGDFSFDDYRRRLLAHPLGRSLRFKVGLARLMYAGWPAFLVNAWCAAVPDFLLDRVFNLLARRLY